MSLLKSLVKTVVNTSKDSIRIAIAPVASSVNSVTNKKTIDLNYDTKVGKVVGGSVTVGTDSLHKGLIGFADAVSGGYATKATDLIRSDDAKVSNVGRVQDEKYDWGVKSKLLDDYESVSKKGGGIIGSIGGAIVASKSSEGGAAEGAAAKGAGEIGTAAKAAEKIAPAARSVENAAPAAAGVIGNTLKTESSTMSLFSTVSTTYKAVDKASQTPTGQAVTSMLGSVIVNLTKPKPPATQNTAPQQAAFNSPTSMNLSETLLSPAAAAVFGNSGQAKFASYDVSADYNSKPGFWDNNKAWLIPVSVVAGILAALATLYKLFTKRRR